MSLEERIEKSFFQRTKSFLAGAALGTYLLAMSSCISGVVGRKTVGREWHRSDKPVQEEVIDSRIGYKKDITHHLGDHISVDYDHNRLVISLSEQETRYPIKVDTIQKTEFLYEMKKEELRIKRPVDETWCIGGDYCSYPWKCNSWFGYNKRR